MLSLCSLAYEPLKSTNADLASANERLQAEVQQLSLAINEQEAAEAKTFLGKLASIG